MAPPPGGLQGYIYCMAVVIKSRAVRRDVGTVINKSKVQVADSRVVSIGVSKAVICGCCVSVKSGLSVGNQHCAAELSTVAQVGLSVVPSVELWDVQKPGCQLNQQ